jgi:hypothetical protein
VFSSGLSNDILESTNTRRKEVLSSSRDNPCLRKSDVATGVFGIRASDRTRRSASLAYDRVKAWIDGFACGVLRSEYEASVVCPA